MISPSVSQGLRKGGIDARAAQGTPETTELNDAEQLSEAVRQRRTLVTYNVKHFVPLAALWFERRQRHYGIVLVSSKSIPQGNVGALIRSLDRLARDYPDEDSLMDQIVFLPALPIRPKA